jgi:DNA-binding response OmpR family regulator
MKILIAEDDLTSRIILESIIGKWAFEVVSVEDGQKAWDILQRQDAPPVAVLDWEMPGIDGPELCRRIKRLSRDNPIYIILLTGRGSKQDLVLGLDAGADDYVTKPFDNNELRARLKVAERLVNTQLSLNRRVQELNEAFDHVKTLQGIIPICMYCHSVRNDTEAWDRLEAYIEQHSEAQFSHSICPTCLQKHFPDLDIEGPLGENGNQ